MVSVQIAALVVALSASGETTLLDFHAPWCAPCRSMEGTIADLKRAGYPVRTVNVDHERSLAKQYNVETIPCFVIVVDGREAGRLTGAVGRDELEAMFTRAGVGRDTAGRETTRAQSPDPPQNHVSLPGPRDGTPLVPSRFERPNERAPVQTSERGPSVTAQDVIQASVRLTIADPQGSSHGTGTLVDARAGEALVLTCGHIFRDSQGKGQILVDLCGPGAPQKVPGRLVSYDLERDVALVSIRPGAQVRVAPLAPKGYRVAEGDRVITVGCNNGGPATAEESSITAVNKFRAGPNLSVAGLPAQGRSGGGLFTTDGQVIGVCNAADPADHEGLYAALAAIQDELDEAGLTEIYENRPQRSTVDAGGVGDLAHMRPPVGGASGLNGAAAGGAVDLAHMPGPAAQPSFAADRGARVIPASTGSLAGVEPAAMAEINARADRAEVICIVRSLSNPDARSEVILLDHASSAFLQQLAADRQAQEARHLTSLKVRSSPRPAHRRER
ncbi:MAG: trypsin-like peptidase domain-containing protein [Pirellulales bacterium]